jgi:hypothetical protein
MNFGNRENLEKLRDLVKRHSNSRIYNYVDASDWKLRFIKDYNEVVNGIKAARESQDSSRESNELYMRIRLSKLNNSHYYNPTERTFSIHTNTASLRFDAVFENLVVFFNSNIISRRLSVYMNGIQKPELTIETHTMFPEVLGEFLPLYWSTFAEIKFVIHDVDESDILDFNIVYGCIGGNHMMEIHNEELYKCDMVDEAFNLGCDPIIHEWKIKEDTDPLNVLYSDQALILVSEEVANNVRSTYNDEQLQPDYYRKKMIERTRGIAFTAVIPGLSELSISTV